MNKNNNIMNILKIIKLIPKLIILISFVVQAQNKYKTYPSVKDAKPLQKIPYILPNFNGQTFYIESAVGSNNRFLKVKGSNPNRNAPLEIGVFTAGKETHFTFEDAGEGYYYIRSNTQQRRAIHVSGRNRNRKAKVTLWDVVNQDNLKWKLIPAGNGYYFIQSQLGTYLDVQWGKDNIGTPVWMWTGPAQQGLAQKWKLHNVKHPVTFKRKFYPKLIKNLCPTNLIRGDREFGGNGPKVTGSVSLIKNRNVYQAQIKFSAKETKHDWSHVTGEWTRDVLFLPVNWKVNKIISPHQNTYFDYTVSTMPSRGHMFTDGGYRPGTLSISRTGIVKRLQFIGDTGGNDISDNNECSDDTRIIFIEIKPLELDITYSPQ